MALFGFRLKRNLTDKLYSDYIRGKANWSCEKCLRDFIDNKQRLEVSHFIGRGNKAVRWNTDNGSSLCYSCARYFERHPNEHVDFVKKKLGTTRYNMLIFTSHLTFKDLKLDEKILRIGFRQMIKELNSHVIGLRQ